MKEKIHPAYKEVNVTCACGETFKTRSTYTKEKMSVEICSKCHPFFTGKQKFVDTAGMVQKFQKKWASTEAQEAQQKTQLRKEKELAEKKREEALKKAKQPPPKDKKKTASASQSKDKGATPQTDTVLTTESKETDVSSTVVSEPAPTAVIPTVATPQPEQKAEGL